MVCYLTHKLCVFIIYINSHSYKLHLNDKILHTCAFLAFNEYFVSNLIIFECKTLFEIQFCYTCMYSIITYIHIYIGINIYIYTICISSFFRLCAMKASDFHQFNNQLRLIIARIRKLTLKWLVRNA